MNYESNNLCERLDAYIDGELDAVGREDFVAHLADCAACREAVDEQRWIDSLLQSDAAAKIEAAPPVTIRMRTSRRWLVAAALAALAAWPLLPLAKREGPEAVVTDSASSADTTTALRSVATGDRARLLPSLPGRGSSDPPVATFASNGNAIAVSQPGGGDVTIVKLYPTYSAAAARRWSGVDARRGTEPNGG